MTFNPTEWKTTLMSSLKVCACAKGYVVCKVLLIAGPLMCGRKCLGRRRKRAEGGAIGDNTGNLDYRNFRWFIKCIFHQITLHFGIGISERREGNDRSELRLNQSADMVHFCPKHGRVNRANPGLSTFHACGNMTHVIHIGGSHEDRGGPDDDRLD
ncbi:hypothetical protein AOLI_G00219520 [Acnodon oligacanthus]